MKIKNAVLFPLLVLAIGGLLWFFLIRFPVMRKESKLEIVPVTHPMVQWIHAKEGQKRVYAMRIQVDGKLDGNADLSLRLNDSIPYLTRALNSGEISMDFPIDWYFDSCQVYYKPIDVKSGDLKITYRFLSVE